MNERKLNELDGFLGLFTDNLLQLLLIVALCQHVCGMPLNFIYQTVLPGAALSILVGNLFYAWQARKLAKTTGRTDVTALPYGINTVSLIAFIFFIMLPAYLATGDWQTAWRVGLVACFGSGVLELAGSFLGEKIRSVTPRGALLSALAGIALTFITMGFVFKVFAFPLISLVPTLLVVGGYGASLGKYKLKLPCNFPVGFLSVLIGVAAYWLLRAWQLNADLKPPAFIEDFGIYLPSLHLLDLFNGFTSLPSQAFIAVILPMGLFNIIGSLQNLESAEAAGDRYNTRSSLLANGGGTILAACLGSPFPTTIYIGHPGWKALGARWRYSEWNGGAITLLTILGAIPMINYIIPLESMLGILIWIGIIMVAQAFSATPKTDFAGVAVGLIPSLAAWALLLIESTTRAAGTSLWAIKTELTKQDIFLEGIIALNQGFIISGSLLATIVIHLIHHRFRQAALGSLLASLLAWFGIIHGYQFNEAGISYNYQWGSAPEFAAAYLLFAGIVIILEKLASTDISRHSYCGN